MKPRAALPFALGTSAFLIQAAFSALQHLAGLPVKTKALASSAYEQIVDSPQAMGWIFYYAIIGILAHTVPLIFVDGITRDLQNRRIGIFTERGTPMLAMLATLATMLLWNSFLFPQDLIIIPTGEVFLPLNLIAAVILSSVVAAIFTTWLYVRFGWRKLSALSLASSSLIFATSADLANSDLYQRPQSELPDLILIGVDSLRPDHLGAFGDPQPATPNIDRFVRDSVTFEQSYTPLGRTFAAYMSVLSGQYPVNNGVRENLYPRNLFDRSNLFPTILRSHGYTTTFGMDESRFANIDASFGFDEIASPPSGVVEFVVGSFFPAAATNLLQEIPLAHRILPHTSGNRALSAQYSPAAYVARLAAAIEDAPSERPLLFMAHFCIAHTPFGTGIWYEQHLTREHSDSPAAYRKALAVADNQVAETLHSLHAHGRLRNAIVVMFSDHGEGLNMKKDKDLANTSLVRSNFGHGNDSLDQGQGRVLLSFQRYIDGKPAWVSNRSSAPASLVDIKPTLMKLLNKGNATRKDDGIALLDRDGSVVAPSSRPLFVESGISGKSLDKSKPDEKEVMAEFSQLYTITEDLRFELMQSRIPEQMRLKQRAVILGGLSVSSMPNTDRPDCWLIVETDRPNPVCSALSTKFSAEVQQRIDLICDHFSPDTEFRERWCRRHT